MQPGRSPQLSSYRSDGALDVSAKRAAIYREDRKRGNAVRDDVGHHRLDHSLRLIGVLQSDTIQLPTQRRDPQNDSESSSSSTVKMTLSPSMEIATPLPQIAQLRRRSQSMREWLKDRLDTQYETSSTSTLVGRAGLVSRSCQPSPR